MTNNTWNFIKLSVGWATTTALLAGCNMARDPQREAPQSSGEAAVSVERGKYLVKASGCNDCHTAGYLLADGNLDEKQWLTGDAMGWRGPWGTTYPSNLRLFMKDLTEDQWVETARHLRRRPPMPWFNLNSMAESDLRSIYRFTRSLGDPGRPAPASLAPGEEPKGPYAQFPGPDQLAQAQVRELVMRLYQGFDSSKLDEFGVVVDSTFRASVMGNQTLDWNGFKSFGAQFMRAFPDGKHEFDRIVVSGDTVVTIGHYVGTHQGELMGIAPSHKRLNLAVMHLDRVANGKVVEHVGIANGSDLVRQLRGKE
ncbi:MAG TPA: ester cyclase [Polyangiaceae bacterium]|nr:ester cyclase [Polyangiaceae bacterium]